MTPQYSPQLQLSCLWTSCSLLRNDAVPVPDELLSSGVSSLLSLLHPQCFLSPALIPQPALWKCSLHPPDAFNPGTMRVQLSWKFPNVISLITPESFISTQWGSRPVSQRETVRYAGHPADLGLMLHICRLTPTSLSATL